MQIFKPNDAQEEAVNSIDGPVLVVSCPGSGKTTTLIRRINNLTRSGVPANKILMVTFSRAAALDMKKRYEQIYGENSGVAFFTIHALCLAILCVYGGYDRDNCLFHENDRNTLILEHIRNNPNIGDAFSTAREISSDISYMKNIDVPLSEFMPRSCDKKLFDEVYGIYEKEKDSQNKLDYDDMLLRCRDLLHRRPDILEKVRARFSHIQCDEYQDTNRVQWNILKMIAGPKPNICVVGDDDQSIYRFRGADSDIMLGFMEEMKDKNPKMIMMSENYRSAPEITEMADACIRFNRKRFSKDIISDRGKHGEKGLVEYKKGLSPQAQMQEVVRNIRAAHDAGIPYWEMAVLFRTNRQAEAPVQTLAAEDIPFNSTETVKTIYDSWMFEDIQSYVFLSMGMDTRDNLLRILNRPNRYLRGAVFSSIPYTYDEVISALKKSMRNEPEWKRSDTERKVKRLLRCFGPGRAGLNMSPKELFERLTGNEGIGYDRYVRDTARFTKKDERDLLDSFALLRYEAEKFQTVKEWFEHADKIRRIARANNEKNNKEGVVIATMHRAKGLEWKVVFIINVNEGTIPSREAESPADIEEERRLLYVAMTRAKDRLYIYNTGAESQFMMQTENTLRVMHQPKIVKKLAGAGVLHRAYGKGKVRGYTGNTIIVVFDDGKERRFAFPDVFADKSLQYT